MKYLFELIAVILLVEGCLSQWEWKVFNGKKYYYSAFDGASAGWHGARAACMSQGGNLASVTNVNERDNIMNELKSVDAGPTWIGLNKLDDRETWKWSDGEEKVEDYWAGDAFIKDEIYGILHLCAYQSIEGDPNVGAWWNDHCDKTLPYVCKADLDASDPLTDPATTVAPGFCPAGYYGFGNKCYLAVFPTAIEDGFTWKEALRICRNQPGKLPDLASFHSPLDAAIVTAHMQKAAIGAYIGYYRERAFSNWKWADNSAADFANWSPTQPGFARGDNCAEVWYSPGPPGTWHNINCDTPRGYICQTYKDSENPIATAAPPTKTCDDPTYTPYGYGCYRFVSAKISWIDAQLNCSHDGGNLVSIHSEAENAAIWTKVFRQDDRVWIGFTDSINNGKYEWTDDWEAYYTHWGDYEPQEQEGGGCVAMDPDGRWYDVVCDTLLTAICKKTDASPITKPPPVEGSCPGDEKGLSEWHEEGSYCYWVSPQYENVPWQTAKERCLEKSQSASLVSIHNQPENKFVFSILGYATSYWIGMYRGAVSKDYRWIDNTAVQYINWAPGEPNGHDDEHCVEMYTDNHKEMWNDLNCIRNRPYVCKAPKMPKVTPPPALEGTCPSEAWDSYGAFCYFYAPGTIGAWKSAVTNCKKIGGENARLPVITSLFQNDYLRKQMNERNEVPVGWDYWIGLVRSGSNGKFDWMDGETAFDEWSVEFWAPYEPSNWEGDDCVAAQLSDGRWNDIPCNVQKSYICEVPKIPLKSGFTSAEMAGLVIGILIFIVIIIALVLFVLDKYDVIDLSKNASDAKKKIMSFTNMNYTEDDQTHIQTPADAENQA